MASLSLAEQETILRYDRESDTATVYTHERRIMALLQGRGFVPVFENVHGGRVVAQSFQVPKSWIAVRPPRKASAAVRAALSRARDAQSASDVDESKSASLSSESSSRAAVSERRSEPTASDLFSSGGAAK